LIAKNLYRISVHWYISSFH